MNTLSKLFLMLAFLASGTIYAQQHFVKVGNAKKVEITNLTGEIKIVGHSVSEIQILASELEAPPERAKGLKPLSGGGVDNSGIGLNVSEAGNVISISGATKKSAEADYIFKVPNSIAVMVDYSSPFTSGEVVVEDFAGEFEMNALNDGVTMKNATGPVYLDLINGNINIDFQSVNQKSPMSIKTINGEIDITFPSSTKSNLELYSLHGDIYTDLDIKIQKPEDEDDKGLRFMGGLSDVKCTLNGGGVKMEVSTINGNLYLRKK